jgi:hypothetical protein
MHPIEVGSFPFKSAIPGKLIRISSTVLADEPFGCDMISDEKE